MTARVILTILFGSAGVYAFIESQHFPDIAGYFPLFASAVVVIFAVVEAATIVYDWRFREFSNNPATLQKQSVVVELAESALHADIDQAAQAERTQESVGELAEAAEEPERQRNEGYYVLWIIGFVVLISVFGTYAAIAVWLAIYGWRVWRARWQLVVLGVVITEALVYGLEWGGIIRVPYGLLFSALFG